MIYFYQEGVWEGFPPEGIFGIFKQGDDKPFVATHSESIAKNIIAPLNDKYPEGTPLSECPGYP